MPRRAGRAGAGPWESEIAGVCSQRDLILERLQEILAATAIAATSQNSWTSSRRLPPPATAA